MHSVYNSGTVQFPLLTDGILTRGPRLAKALLLGCHGQLAQSQAPLHEVG